MDEEWESTYFGAEKTYEGSRTGAGELAGSQEPSGHTGSGKPDVIKEGRWQAKNKKIVKKSLGDKGMRQKMKPTEVIHQYADLVDFRIKQLSTDSTKTVPLEGFEKEWERAKETLCILADIYKRLETDQFKPEPKDEEKLYDIIANILLSNLTVHVDKTGINREIVTLLSVPDGDIQHGIRIEIEGTGSVRKIISHSFF